MSVANISELICDSRSCRIGLSFSATWLSSRQPIADLQWWFSSTDVFWRKIRTHITKLILETNIYGVTDGVPWTSVRFTITVLVLDTRATRQKILERALQYVFKINWNSQVLSSDNFGISDVTTENTTRNVTITRYDGRGAKNNGETFTKSTHTRVCCYYGDFDSCARTGPGIEVWYHNDFSRQKWKIQRNSYGVIGIYGCTRIYVIYDFLMKITKFRSLPTTTTAK